MIILPAQWCLWNQDPYFPSASLIRSPMAEFITPFLRKDRRRFPLLELIKCPVFARRCLTLPLADSRTRFLIPLCVFIFGIVSILLSSELGSETPYCTPIQPRCNRASGGFCLGFSTPQPPRGHSAGGLGIRKNGRKPVRPARLDTRMSHLSRKVAKITWFRDCGVESIGRLGYRIAFAYSRLLKKVWRGLSARIFTG